MVFFITVWNEVTRALFIILLVMASGLVLYYNIRLGGFGRNYKRKYDFIARYEIEFFWIASLLLVGAGVMYFVSGIASYDAARFFVRVFVTVCIGLIHGVIIRYTLKVYYPSFLQRRLHELRHRPRLSPVTGKSMKLLSEEEEDLHLAPGMQSEEKVRSVDYDVWRDEDTGYIQVEKYAGTLSIKECPKCSYQTYRIVREEMAKITEGESGEIVQFFSCGYCGHKSSRNVPVKVGNAV